MSVQQKRYTILLSFIMVICLVLTALLLTNSIECGNCGKKITGKYYITVFDDFYCKDCGKEYYIGWPGDLDNVSDKVDNTLRNILILVELVGFIGAILVVNKKKGIDTTKKSGTSSTITKKIPVIKDEVKKVVEPIVKRERTVDIKPGVEVEGTPPIRKEEIVEKTPISTEPKSELRTTFKPKSDSNM